MRVLNLVVLRPRPVYILYTLYLYIRVIYPSASIKKYFTLFNLLFTVKGRPGVYVCDDQSFLFFHRPRHLNSNKNVFSEFSIHVFLLSDNTRWSCGSILQIIITMCLNFEVKIIGEFYKYFDIIPNCS